jgi:RNA polymerase sigma factor (sigma-70 family)
MVILLSTCIFIEKIKVKSRFVRHTINMDVILPYQMADVEKKEYTITQTIKKYGKRLFSFIKAKMNLQEDAEDVLQEVWYQLSNLSNINDLENTSAWLYAVSKNKITDFYRKKKPDYLEDYTYEDEDGIGAIKDILLIDDSGNPELAIFKDMFWQELINALDELPKNQKDVFVLNELEDKTLQEIANIQGENIKTIISRKGYAVKHLRKKLNNLYQDIIN